MRGRITEAQLDDYLKTWMERNFETRLYPWFQAYIVSVTPETTPHAGYFCQVQRVGDTVVDQNSYLCVTPGYIPQVGDFVECVMRDDRTGYVLWELSVSPEPLGIAQVLNAPLQVRLAGRIATPGAPTLGTWMLSDIIIDSNRNIWICTSAGTPGSWRLVGPSNVYSPGSFTILTESFSIWGSHLKLTGTQRVTVQGTGRLLISG